LGNAALLTAITLHNYNNCNHATTFAANKITFAIHGVTFAIHGIVFVIG